MSDVPTASGFGLLQASEGLLPHGVCFVGKQDLILLHVISDAIIAAAYFMIPVILIYFLRAVRSRISFHWAIGLFAAFIVLCGSGHILDIVTIWNPIYYLQGWQAALTAVVSIATAVAIIPLVPKLLAMRTPEELEATNKRLSEEIKAREHVEAELRRSLTDLNRAVHELEQFAYITSHDLQAPLRNIAGFSQLLTRRYSQKLDGDALEFMQFIEAGVRQMQALIQGLLALSRIGRSEGKAEQRSLDDPLRSALAALRQDIATSGAQVKAEPLPTIKALQPLLVQLFQNLIGNAIKFQKPGSTAVVHVSGEVEGEAVHLRVRDNGIGIPPDQLENVFAVFRRLHTSDEYEGTGMGLAICRKIVQSQGGDIWAESDGNGTTVHVRLPLVPPVQRAAGPRPAGVIAAAA